ncbi:MAG: outer membrane protein assembly factor BamD [Marinomonas foliarum]|jgi:outer membrane protein assembly factor BamD|uniref:Outer membrane protein assembly factor BamD n=1 Tax=Marinomonas foliarum TaxID=491950 RepID=A0A368ZL94_9GAMM|nr:outer membrane protein assembly factor BamD [Marinomonas foliarum]QRV25035.1 outer membrane protein assembly factor BamD [Marinomonas foliarum]RCW94374.1 Beta-barrel assembly machine subunit BamD [Marinomonas foliarum]
MGFHHSLLRFSGIVSFSLFIAACSSTQVQEPDLPERVYYNKAQQALEDNLPSTAIKHLKDLDSRYPFGEFSTRAELDLIYAQMEAGDFISAHSTTERFIKNHPEHDSIDYAYYMRALSTYKGAESFMSRYLDLDPSERDSKELSRAFSELADFTSRFPNSKYAPDAKARMFHLREMVSRHELKVANYYLKRKAPLSALRRSQEVILHYPSTRSVEEALAISIQSYMDLQQTDLANTNLAVLKQNFPESKHLDEEGKFIQLELPNDADPSFLYWVTFGLMG